VRNTEEESSNPYCINIWVGFQENCGNPAGVDFIIQGRPVYIAAGNSPPGKPGFLKMGRRETTLKFEIGIQQVKALSR
jgi:hypothetical protein